MVAPAGSGPPAWLLGATAAYDGAGQAHPVGLGVQLGGTVAVEGQLGVRVEIRHDHDSPREGGATAWVRCPMLWAGGVLTRTRGCGVGP